MRLEQARAMKPHNHLLENGLRTPALRPGPTDTAAGEAHTATHQSIH